MILSNLSMLSESRQDDYPKTPDTVRQETNYNLEAIVTPINVAKLQQLLEASHYDPCETQFLVKGFTEGFRIGYHGPRNIKRISNNLKFRVGDKFDLWDKIMTEVTAGRYAGPYDLQDEIFPEGYSVNPCGLVPKSNNRMRLINHYSFPHGESINDYIPDNYSKVTYQDFQDAIKISLDLLQEEEQGKPIDLHFARTDAQNAFRVLPIYPMDRCFQLLKATNPKTDKVQFFVDLCCGFGCSSSCFLYSKVSSCIRHIYRWRAGIDGVVYLDDGLQIGRNEKETNYLLSIYLGICSEINLPVAEEKTETACRLIKFLGLLINALKQTVKLPSDKVVKALNQIEFILGSKKVTVLDMQRITGLLNFFTRAIVPGRAFTRRLYAAYSGANLKQHHHIRVTQEMKLDLGMWKGFLKQEGNLVRPFVDFAKGDTFMNIPMTSDAAKAPHVGFAACLHDERTNTLFYCFDQWEPGFIQNYDPSVQFLELFALTVGIVLFSAKLKNSRVRILCDNQAVIHMVNETTSLCKHCMILIRLLVLAALENNVVYEVDYIESKHNRWSDLLSRMKWNRFREESGESVNLVRVLVPEHMLPVAKFYKKIKF